MTQTQFLVRGTSRVLACKCVTFPWTITEACYPQKLSLCTRTKLSPSRTLPILRSKMEKSQSQRKARRRKSTLLKVRVKHKRGRRGLHRRRCLPSQHQTSSPTLRDSDHGVAPRAGARPPTVNYGVSGYISVLLFSSRT